jgi:hypothetical protein
MEIRNCTACDQDINRLTFSRYVKISSLVDLLHGKIFIPSFETLRKADPQELDVPAYSFDFLERAFFNNPTFEQEQQWLQQRWEERIGTKFREVEDLKDRVLFMEWIRELAHRRCTWCWFVSLDCTEESIAMWNLYAKDGVLIKTTWEGIQNTLASELGYEAALFKVNYVRVGEHDDKFTSAENLNRPYLFKSKGYKHEQEMRVVFSKQGSWLHPGVTLQADPKNLIKWLTFSPYLSGSEVESLKQILFANDGAERTPRLPGVVIDHSQRALEEGMPESFFAPVNESPVDIPSSIRTL